MSPKATMIEAVDAEELVDLVVERVVEEIRPLLEKAPAANGVDAEEMGRLLSVSRSTIDRLASARKIPTLQVGNVRRFNPAAVYAALETKGK